MTHVIPLFGPQRRGALDSLSLLLILSTTLYRITVILSRLL